MTADAGVNLAKGAGTVAAAKAAGMRESAMERISETAGGKIASAIKAQGNAIKAQGNDSPSFDGNSLSGNSGGNSTTEQATGSQSAQAHAEVASFTNRDGTQGG